MTDGERPVLSPWDGVSVIVGIVVGVSLFRAPGPIFASVDAPWEGMALWALGGALSLVGALCYAELAASDPRSGGDYRYLTRAFGPAVGFLFGWAQLVAILTGSIGAMAYVFADYARVVWPGASGVGWAAAVVVGLTLPNLFGVELGRRVQNTLTVIKIVGLLALVAAAFFAPAPDAAAEPGPNLRGYGFALILVLYAYGGWNDAAFVASEVRDPRRNVPRVLLLGTGAIVAVYLVVNAAYLSALGFAGLRASQAPAAAVLAAATGTWGERVMSLLVMVSALGAVQGLLFTGSRIYASVGRDHALFARLGRWHPRWGTPVGALLAQTGVTLAWIAGVGTERGRAVIDGGLGAIGLPALPWERFGAGFDTLVAGTAPVFWLFFLATGVALMVLRRREPDAPRPFRVPLYPLTPLVFCGSCLYMLHASLDYAGGLAVVGLLPLALGLPLYFLSRRAGRTGGGGQDAIH
ncbi:MAG: APC family permease [Myxococcota bacterium]